MVYTTSLPMLLSRSICNPKGRKVEVAAQSGVIRFPSLAPRSPELTEKQVELRSRFQVPFPVALYKEAQERDRTAEWAQPNQARDQTGDLRPSARATLAGKPGAPGPLHLGPISGAVRFEGLEVNNCSFTCGHPVAPVTELGLHRKILCVCREELRG